MVSKDNQFICRSPRQYGDNLAEYFLIAMYLSRGKVVFWRGSQIDGPESKREGLIRSERFGRYNKRVFWVKLGQYVGSFG